MIFCFIFCFLSKDTYIEYTRFLRSLIDTAGTSLQKIYIHVEVSSYTSLFFGGGGGVGVEITIGN